MVVGRGVRQPTDGGGGGGGGMAAGAGPTGLRWSAWTTEAGGPQPGCRRVRLCVFAVQLVWAAGSASGGRPARRRTRRPAAEMSSWRLAGGPSGSTASIRTETEGLVGLVAGGAVRTGRRRHRPAGHRISQAGGSSSADAGGRGRLGRPGRAGRGNSGVQAAEGNVLAALTAWCRLGQAGMVWTGWLGWVRFCCGLWCLCRAGGGVLVGAGQRGGGLLRAGTRPLGGAGWAGAAGAGGGGDAGSPGPTRRRRLESAGLAAVAAQMPPARAGWVVQDGPDEARGASWLVWVMWCLR